ncbi:heme ABC transporter permease [Pacificimonas flava]|uniref:Heme exporter protein C n=1 Tax=Pacificimonas flava TaxID=1234595 RepID=M2SAV0_9SPHN|nr:heme ABC transporter permease [Pacificimonas flava]EMD82515.1 Cytochrome c-type biogenesis protein CcmC [Pacificimonas flava]MBB5281346.1 heme exporter protein C [Pacificimonas flava]
MHRFANPARFLRIARPATPLTFWTGLAIVATGLAWGVFLAPGDYLQGESVRMLYVHVPTAWLSLSAYLGLGIAGFSVLVWKHPLAEVVLAALAPIGAAFAAVCLITGSIWGRPTWGTWWVWDGRLTSMLVLLFLYLGVIALMRAYDEPSQGARMGSVLALLGLVNLPIIKFSVEWWNTLHQPASITLSGSSIDSAMLWPLLTSAVGFALLMASAVLMRMRALIAERKVAARTARMAMAAA